MPKRHRGWCDVVAPQTHAKQPSRPQVVSILSIVSRPHISGMLVRWSSARKKVVRLGNDLDQAVQQKYNASHVYLSIYLSKIKIFLVASIIF